MAASTMEVNSIEATMQIVVPNHESLTESNKIALVKRKTDKDEIYFTMNKDIYNFFCLMVDYDNFKDLSIGNKISLTVFATFSFLTQLVGVIFIIVTRFSDQLTDLSTFGTINCANINYSSSFNVTGTNFNGKECSITEEWYGAQAVTSAEWAARFIAISILLCFINANITSAVRYSLILSKKKKKYAKLLWSSLVIFQLLVVGSSVHVIVLLIQYAISIIDILSVGIGFIILMEIDDVMYNAVININPYQNGDDIFKFKFDKNSLKYTVYSIKYITPG
eukprot:299710_1